MNIEDTCKHTKIRLIAAAIAHQQCTQTAGTEVQITGTDKRILIGDDAYLAKVAAPAAQAPSQVPAELEEAVRAAMKRAYNLGQTYWQQADSEYTSQHKKADVTAGRFIELTDEICSKVRLSAVREDTLTIDALAAAFKRAGLDIQWVGKDVRKPMTYGSIELAELLKVFNELRVDGAAVREARNEALEEAAKLVLSKAGQQISFADMTGAIRALKAESPTASKEGDTRG